MVKRKITYLLIAIIVVAAAVGVMTGRSESASETTLSALAKNTHFHGIAVDLKDSLRLYLATHHGLHLVAPNGKAARVSDTADGTIYAFQIGTGLIQKSKPTWNWQLVNNDFGDAYIPHLAVDPSDGQKLYAVTFNSKTRAQAILASRDGGATWTKLGGD